MRIGSIHVRTPLFWVIGWVFMFAAGMVTSIPLAIPEIDYGVHDTYYVVAHHHYLLSLGVVFAFFAGFYYLFERMFRVRYDARLAQAHFWTFFIGVNTVFFPQHFLGPRGMPLRRLDDPAAFALWNQVSSVGYWICLASLGVFVAVLIEAAVRRRARGR